jgi:hypothetical protein
MPRLNKFEIEIKSGKSAHHGPILYRFNGFEFPLEPKPNVDENLDAGTNPIFRGISKDLDSMIHTMTLVGPESGEWEIEEFKVTYHLMDGEPFSMNFGKITLNESNMVNIWKGQPLPSFEV